MISKDVEQQIGLDVPLISPKTPREQVKKWSKDRWPHDARRGAAADIVKNGRELRAGSDWDLVLEEGIRTQHANSVQFGEAAIAAHDAHMIGGLAVAAGWAMHDPAIVYLSGKCLANRAGDTFEDFKSTMRQVAVAYGQKVLLPRADLYMETLDFLLELTDRNRHRNIIKQVASLLGKGDIEGAHGLINARADPVGRRGKGH